MDGVIYHGNKLLPGAKEFIIKLKELKKSFIFITNASDKTRHQLVLKLNQMGIATQQSDFLTSAMATAEFVSKQKPCGSAFVIGDDGLEEALKLKNFRLIQSEEIPDYVIVGGTRSNDIYNHTNIKIAINHVLKGAALIGTNKDVLDNSENGYTPGCGALLAPIQIATGVNPYYLGKPNSIMMNLALEMASKRDGIEFKRENIVIIGDRMDTDILGGIESGICTILLLSGISKLEDIKTYSYSPDMIFNNLNEILNEI
jgi:NagD protein